MRSRVLCFALAFVFLSCAIVFSGVSIKASADNIVTQMSISDTRALFGDTISGTVKSSSGTVWNRCTFSYVGSVSSVSVSGMNLAVNDFANNVSQFPDYAALLYSCPVSDVSSYYDFILDIPVYFPDYALGAIGISNMLDGHEWSGITQSGNVASSYPDNYYSGFDAVLAREPSTVYGVYYYDYTFYRLFPYLVDSNGEYLSSLHVQSVRSYAVNYQPAVLMMIFCPNVGSQPSNTEPVQTTTTETSSGGAVTTGNISVDVNVDLDETNGILGDILSVLSDFVSDIIDGIEGLFVLDEDYLENWLSDLIDLFEDKFGATGIDITPLKNALLDMATYGATTSIRFPGIDLTSCGIPFTIPARAVDLQPFGSPIDTYIELSVNIAATLAVFNLLFTKIKAVLVGERVVEIEGDD